MSGGYLPGPNKEGLNLLIYVNYNFKNELKQRTPGRGGGGGKVSAIAVFESVGSGRGQLACCGDAIANGLHAEASR